MSMRSIQEGKYTQLYNQIDSSQVSSELHYQNISIFGIDPNNSLQPVNIDSLLANVRDEYKAKAIRTLRSLPQEVLNDLRTEVYCVHLKPFEESWAAAAYTKSTNEIVISSQHNYHSSQLAHEIGHAIDALQNGSESNELTSRKQFLQTFEAEHSLYVQNGGIPYHTAKTGENYFSSDIAELAAEVYMWRHFPNVRAKERALAYKHFPETIKLIENYFDSISGLPRDFKDPQNGPIKYKFMDDGRAFPIKKTYNNGPIVNFQYDENGNHRCITKRYRNNDRTIRESDKIVQESVIFSNERAVRGETLYGDGTCAQSTYNYSSNGTLLTKTTFHRVNDTQGRKKSVISYLDGKEARIITTYKDGNIETIDYSANNNHSPKNIFTGRKRQ